MVINHLLTGMILQVRASGFRNSRRILIVQFNNASNYVVLPEGMNHEQFSLQPGKIRSKPTNSCCTGIDCLVTRSDSSKDHFILGY